MNKTLLSLKDFYIILVCACYNRLIRLVLLHSFYWGKKSGHRVKWLVQGHIVWLHEEAQLGQDQWNNSQFVIIRLMIILMLQPMLFNVLSWIVMCWALWQLLSQTSDTGIVIASISQTWEKGQVTWSSHPGRKESKSQNRPALPPPLCSASSQPRVNSPAHLWFSNILEKQVMVSFFYYFILLFFLAPLHPTHGNLKSL